MIKVSLFLRKFLHTAFCGRSLVKLLCALAMGYIATASAQAESGAYVPYSGIIHGTDSAESVTLAIENKMDLSLRCEAGLAHWYSETLGLVAPQKTLSITLWHDPKTGALNLLNASQARMPVEAVWCGGQEDFSATRTRLNLSMREGALATDTLQFACKKSKSVHRISCTVAPD